MPVYAYTALDKAGKTKKGILDADSTVAARQKLRGTGIFPVEVREALSKRREGRPGAFSLLAFLKRVKPGEVYAVTRQLSTLLGAGVPLVASLDALISQITNPMLKKITAQIKDAVNEGNTLAFSLSQHPRLFSNLYINMVHSGEASGSLDVVLDRLAEFGEHQQALTSRFRAALIYPMFISIFGAGVLFFLVTFIIPDITEMFSEMHQTLPLPTVVLVSVSHFLKTFWWVVLLGLMSVIGIVKQLIKRPTGHHKWDEIKLRLPVLGPINQKMALARFGRTLGTLLQGGVSLLSSLEIVRNIVNNVLIAEVIDKVVEEIGAGKSLAGSLSQSRWFPSMVVQMIHVGEQSGELENMLDKIADIHEREAESHIMALTSMLEPVLIMVMGLIVLFVVISILLPIFEMNQMIR